MKRSPLKRKTPLRRGKRLRAKGGSRFPHRRDPEYMAWLAEQVKLGHLCDGCGERYAMHRAHLDPKGNGGDDRNNVALLCALCHPLQEKRTEQFEQEMGVDLRAKARAHTERYLVEAT